jgi:hypothetical protein
MVRWAVTLAGGHYDLEDLAARTWSDAAVERNETGWLLRSPLFERLSSASDVHSAAGGIVKRLNDAAGLDFQRYSGVRRGDAVFDDAGDERKTTTFARADVRSGGRLGIVGAGGVPAPTLAERAYALAPKHEALDDALRAFGAADWIGWYKVTEILEDEGVDPVAEECVTASELTRLKWTANHQDAAGDGARHARLHTDPPPEPHMTEFEGQGVAGRLIGCLVRHIEQRGA